ncbi:MAG TPA: cell envelope integrity protein CreD [Bacteroidales bacterium]|nr:cell envelope integrity protein CreD [Bacteroidales bacterium]HPF01757.1 cell envelope integrity protein CreD [Bacteroidales bacterium]HRW84089.1 cell envelope integrity protein CreD [Bacteroidales bacterium]
MKIEISNQGKWNQSLTLKLALLAFMGILLLIPLQIIISVIQERQSNAEKVKKEISDQWAAKQCITGPVLNIPVRTRPADKEEIPSVVVWHIMPEALAITGKINPEIRYRGIYKTAVYKSDLLFEGTFTVPDRTTMKDYDILWDQAYFTAGITDNRGLNGEVIMKAGPDELEGVPGVSDKDIFQSGISFLKPLTSGTEKINFSLMMHLSGSEGLLFTPLGKVTDVKLESEWTSPGFSGSFLPAERVINDNGFTARWQVTHLNRNFPQEWTGSSFDPNASAFGVDLFMPVDHYQKSMRSAKYGILFIALTFLVLIFLEITRKEFIHLFNYFLVALALVLFFSLLNSLSEHTGFNLAYLISSASIILMISLFTGALLKNKRIVFIVFALLVFLYSFIYILLSLNDYAYLAGNAGLFVLLAVVMWFASRMNFFRKEVS